MQRQLKKLESKSTILLLINKLMVWANEASIKKRQKQADIYISYANMLGDTLSHIEETHNQLEAEVTHNINLTRLVAIQSNQIELLEKKVTRLENEIHFR